MKLLIHRATGNDGPEKFYVVKPDKMTRSDAIAVFSDYQGASEYIKNKQSKKQRTHWI